MFQKWRHTSTKLMPIVNIITKSLICHFATCRTQLIFRTVGFVRCQRLDLHADELKNKITFWQWHEAISIILQDYVQTFTIPTKGIMFPFQLLLPLHTHVDHFYMAIICQNPPCDLFCDVHFAINNHQSAEKIMCQALLQKHPVSLMYRSHSWKEVHYAFGNYVNCSFMTVNHNIISVIYWSFVWKTFLDERPKPHDCKIRKISGFW